MQDIFSTYNVLKRGELTFKRSNLEKYLIQIY